MDGGYVALEDTTLGFFSSGLAYLEVVFRKQGSKGRPIMRPSERCSAASCDRCSGVFFLPLEAFERDGRKCGQCGIELRRGRTGCHWCGWKPESAGPSGEGVKP